MSPTSTAGYSGRPLTVKLGIVETTRGIVLDAPPDYRASLEAESSATLGETLAPELDFIQLFVTRREALARALPRALANLVDRGMIWVSWPKRGKTQRAAKVPTDMTEDVVREVALPLGLVDVKVCAVDEVWSGLKLVRRLPAKQRRR